MNTRINVDAARCAAQNDQASFPGQYQIQTPGQNGYVPYFSDINIRLQKWGGNMRTNTFELEAALQGRNRGPISGGGIRPEVQVESQPLPCGTSDFQFTTHARIVDPAWDLRDKPITRWDTSLVRPRNANELFAPAPVMTNLAEIDKYTRANQGCSPHNPYIKPTINYS